ncbi:MAG TPA: hypothetical protein VKY19_02990 [Ktedonosporobacter sp.]|jgi:hypothetical protein|nr:hypothetical protein [Ktedonosporobacter sp.]
MMYICQGRLLLKKYVIRQTYIAFFACCLLATQLGGCSLFSASGSQQPQKTTFTSSASSSSEPITYSTGAHDVLIRTFYGGGLYGSLELAPQVSIYGDGTYILGQDQQGTISSDALQQLLDTLVNTDGLLHLKRQQFIDIPDQNATFLELSLNDKQLELVYGPFGNQQESADDMDEYHRLGKALSTITATLKGPTHPYHSSSSALLVRQIFHPDFTQTILYWPLYEFTLSQAAIFECGIVPPDENSSNAETGCLKYLIPDHAQLLTASQLQTLRTQLNNRPEGIFTEQGLYYEVTLRPLLPDELAHKTVAMFGSAQGSYRGVPLNQGTIPAPTPTPTP